MSLDRYVNAVVQANQLVIDKQLKQLEDVANKLQRRMIALLNEASDTTQLIDLALARQDVIKILEDSGYYNVINKGLSQDYQDIISKNLKFYETYLDKTLQYQPISVERLSLLREATFDEFKTLGDRQVNALQKIMLDLNFGAIDRKEAINVMESIMNERFKGEAERLVNTSVQGFSRTVNNTLAIDNGINKFEYYGPKDKITRPFCSKILSMEQKEFSKKEIDQMDNGQGLSVFTYCGGYQCRHQWVAIVE